MSTIFEARVGDAKKPLTTVLGDATLTPEPIPAGATVTFKAILRGETITGSADPDPDQSANPGLVTYTLTAADLTSPTPGWWDVHWIVALTTGQTDSYPLGGFDVLVIWPAP